MKADWKEKAFESCLDRFRVTAKIPKKQFADEGQFPIVSQEADFINGYWNSEADVCSLDAPVVIYGDHTQVVKYVDFDFVVGADGVKVLKPKDFIDPRFLYYFVMAHRVPSLGYARHYRHLKDQAIKYPPLEEQQRIVAVLDEAFEGMARARAHAEANLQNARELFGSELASVCKKNAEEYGTVSLAEISEEITDGDHMPPPKAQVGVPFVTIKNIDKETHYIDFSNTFKVPESYYQELKDKRKPRLGDVLYTVTGSFGIPVLVQAEQRFCFQRHIGLIRPRQDISPEWLYFVLVSPFVFEQADAGATGTAQRTVSLKLLRSMVVPSVPSELQTAIAARFRGIHSEASRLAVSYQAKLQDLDDLRQSLLQKAFAGELT